MEQTPIIRNNNGYREVFDPVRQRYVALTPEEWIRQNLIVFLHNNLGYPLELMQVEGSIKVNGLSKRCDIVIYDATVRPIMIVETKKPEVSINAKVIDQACRYNLKLQVPLLLLTNGKQTLILQSSSTGKSLQQLPSIPTWQQLQESTATASKNSSPDNEITKGKS